MEERKHIKHLFIKTITIAIAMVYVLNPVHQPVIKVLHIVSHNLEESISKLGNSDHSHQHHSHKHPHTHTAVNPHQEQMDKKEGHSHPVLDFFASAFSDSEQDEAITNFFKLDKHILNNQKFSGNTFEIISSKKYWFLLQKKYLKYQYNTTPPPRQFS